MPTEFVSPIGRFVQGSLTLETKDDMKTKQPKTDAQGDLVKECYIGLAIKKDDPGLPAFYALFVAQAQADFPHLFVNGQCQHPRFAWKIQDGDGVDASGQSVANKPGFKGCFIFKFGTRYLPKCFHAGKYDPSQQIQNPEQVIKRGYYIRVAGTINGNGVAANEREAVPGLYLSPNLIEFVAYGEEIVGGMDAGKTFGAAAMPALPAGASAAPVGHAALSPPPVPGMATAGLPSLPGAPAGFPPLPGTGIAPQAPSYQMTPKAMGATREQCIAIGWTDDKMIAEGLMLKL